MTRGINLAVLGVVVLALVATLPAVGGGKAEVHWRALHEELIRLEELDAALKRGDSSEKTLREMRPVNEKLKAIAGELERLLQAKGEEAGEQAAKEFFSECTGLGTRLDDALRDTNKLPEVHKAVVSVVKVGRDLAVFEPND